MDEEMRMWTEVCVASSADDPAAATAIQHTHTNKRSRIQADQETATAAAVSAAVSSRVCGLDRRDVVRVAYIGKVG